MSGDYTGSASGIDFAAALAREGYGGGEETSRGSGLGGAWCVPPLLAVVFGAGAGLAFLETLHLGTVTLVSLMAYGAATGALALVSSRLLRRAGALPVFALGILFAVVALYADWFWFFALDRHVTVWNPVEMVRRALDLADTRELTVFLQGRRSSGIQTFSGGSLLVCQLAEAVFLVTLVLGVLHLGVRKAFLCKPCSRWGRGRFRLENLCLLVPESRAFVQLAAGDVSPLLSASPVESRGHTVVTVEVRFCETCRAGAMWVSRVEGHGRGARYRRTATAVGPLQNVALAPDAVRALQQELQNATAYEQATKGL